MTSCASFINPLIRKHEPCPRDAGELQLSGPALKHMMRALDVDPEFIGSLCRHRNSNYSFLPLSTHGGDSVHGERFWYILPVRFQTRFHNYMQTEPCTHPFESYMFAHLNTATRGFHIAIHVSRLCERQSVIVLHLMDGAWRQLLDVPQSRIREKLETTPARLWRLLVPLLYLQSIVRNWNSVLTSFNNSLLSDVSYPLWFEVTSLADIQAGGIQSGGGAFG